MKISAVDLFCGAGGLTYGLEQADIDVKMGVDNDRDSEYPYEENTNAEYPDLDVSALPKNPEKIACQFGWETDISLLTACAPCQPYSTMGHAKDEGHEDHTKWGMLRYVISIVKEVQPDVVVTENVLQVRHDDLYEQFVGVLENLGYAINSDENKNVYCPEYGIPQKRKRWVLLASREGPIRLPDPPITDESEYPTVCETIDHLPPLRAGEVDSNHDLHRARSLSELNLERIENMDPGADWRLWEDRGLDHLLADCHTRDSGRSYKAPYSRMLPDEPAPTITTQFYNYGSGRFGHYDTEQNRALSLLEGALLQTFPADYDFYEDWDEVGVKNLGKLIGNAVPPLLGEFIGKAVVQHVSGTSPASRASAIDD